VANLSNHLSSVGVLLGSIMGLKERLMFFSVGLAHYMLSSVLLNSASLRRSALFCSARAKANGCCMCMEPASW